MKAPAAASPGCGLFVDPQRPISFTFEERPIAVLEGQSIAAALYAAGVRVFTRSFKYHRPRGLFCVSGDCPNCLMNVDGKPNVRTCIEPARDGMVVTHQNAWPSLNFDLLRVFDRVDRLLPVGFYYKRFHKPRWLWPIFEHVVRHVAGLGSIDVAKVPDEAGEVEYVHTDVCIVGGGPAGLAAAAAAGQAGADVLLLERMPRLGGHLLYQGQQVSEIEPLVAALNASEKVRILPGSGVFGIYEGNLLGAVQGSHFLKIRARQIVVCTGGREQPFVFHNNDLPGIFLARGVQRLLRLYGVAAGQQAVVVTDHDGGYQVARDLAENGIPVRAIVDARLSGGIPAAADAGMQVFTSSVVSRACGGSRLKAVRVVRRNPNGAIEAGSEQEVPCDLLCIASTLAPVNELLLQAGVRFQHHNGRWEITRPIIGISAAGAASGIFDLPGQLLEGRLRGAEAAAALGLPVADLDQVRQQWQARRMDVGAVSTGRVFPQQGAGHRKRFVCQCEDVTEKDLDMAVAEGFDGIETLKRYSTVTMGPCQGKMCQLASVEICARAVGQNTSVIGLTTARPPAMPVEMGVLAASRHHPVRRTPLHHWHEAAGARWMDAGQWKRPETYGDPVAEVRAVRNGVGLIDVSTLGKIEVTGPDAVELLERVYLNKWKDLKIGRTRYGVMCNEDGIIYDDGVAARLGPDHFYLTATTGNAEGVVQWLEMWKATWRLNATILDKTAAVAAMNLAGPKAREVLARLTALDLSPKAFPYLAMREGEVAGVACRLMWIGFVGESGYEIHCPASHAWHLWEALILAGADFGVKPFGVEAQRILRLEKGHIIVSVDTDALSNPLEAGLEWMVHLDKPFFIGQGPIRRLKEMGPRSRLVGFFMEERDQVPSEGCQVVENGYPGGRITSSRYSPTLDRSLGLAWVPIQRSAAGERFQIRWNGRDVTAVVTPVPFYDPDGKRLKS